MSGCLRTGILPWERGHLARHCYRLTEGKALRYGWPGLPAEEEDAMPRVKDVCHVAGDPAVSDEYTRVRGCPDQSD